MKVKLDIEGPKGRLSAILNKPDISESVQCPLVILMHGFMSNKRLEPLKSIARDLETAGIASLRFDFDGHGSSDGKFCEMTVETELADAMAVYKYASRLDFVSKIALAGHSQGGVVAGMTAGRLGADRVKCLVQLAPAAVLKDDAINGVLMGRHYDPKNLPESLRVLFHKVGKCYFEVAQNIPIYEISSAYDGPVLLIHGRKDTTVPYSYSEHYHECLKNSTLILLDGENHILSKRRKEVIADTVSFIEAHLQAPSES